MLYIKKDGTVIHRAQLASVIEGNEMRPFPSEKKEIGVSFPKEEEISVLTVKTMDGKTHRFTDEEVSRVKTALGLH